MLQDFLKEALKKGNEVQDALTNNFKKGRTGNTTLKWQLNQVKWLALATNLYTSSWFVWSFCRDNFGMWDAQEGIPGSGEHPLYENTTYAIELNAKFI